VPLQFAIRDATGVKIPGMYAPSLRWFAGFTVAVGALLSARAAMQSQGQAFRPLAHFHHVHLNATDPQAAISFYTAKLPSQKRKFAGAVDAVWTHKSWILFTKVAAPPKSEITSAIWHMGWGGGENMRETYQKQLDSGTKFRTPLTDISDQCDGKGGNGRFFFSYIDGPDHALIELNTTAANVTYFGHVHLLSEDPIAASEWYVKEFGLQRRGSNPPSRELRYRCGRQTGPSAPMTMDDVSIIIYPVGNAKAAFPDAWKDRDGLESSQGHTIDHLGFSVDNLDQTMERLRKDGVKVTDEPRSVFGGKIKFAFVEGPDSVRLEVLEDHTAEE
jgi:catechol 2,3-dioxygenase-like lactoylglutathione lyase family enzyme